MLDIFIFFLHIFGWTYAFTKVWQTKGTKYAFLSVVVLGFLFIILWTITSPFAKLIMPKSWDFAFFTADTLSLILLLIPETIFYYIYFIKSKSI